MFLDLDPVLLARIQFAFTVSFHIIFPAFTIGLASWLAVVEWRYLRTGKQIYEEIYRMWTKIFAVCFGMGVVSGVVMSYQFGTNWSVFSDKIGNVIGPLLGYEVLTAFFLEASFLGIMLFGWGRVSKRMHFVSTCVVAVGTVISAFWILSANSWMQTPQGFMIDEQGLMHPTSWIEVIFNPSFPYRFAHMVTAAYLTTAFAVGGVGAYYLLKRKYVAHGKIIFAMAMIMAVFVAPLQLVIGHMHGENTMEYQPIKVAAMEANWERGNQRPLYLFGMPNEETQQVDYAIEWPGMASWILTGDKNGEIPGLNDVPADEHPPVAMVFWAFRVMVGLGMLMILTGAMAAILFFSKRLFTARWFHRWCIALSPAGFIAVLAGWFVTEIGRQPYTVYGVLRTAQSISPVQAEQVAFSLAAFIVVYTLIFGAAIYYIFKLVRKGPLLVGDGQKYYDHGMEASVVSHAAKQTKKTNKR